MQSDHKLRGCECNYKGINVKEVGLRKGVPSRCKIKGMYYNHAFMLSMSITSAECTLLYSMSMWPDRHFCDTHLGIGRGRVNPMGCRVGYSGVGIRVEVCPPCEDPHPRLGYPGYSGYWTVHAMPVHASDRIGLLQVSNVQYSILPRAQAAWSPHAIILSLPLLLFPFSTLIINRLKPFPKQSKACCSLDTNFHGQRHADCPHHIG